MRAEPRSATLLMGEGASTAPEAFSNTVQLASMVGMGDVRQEVGALAHGAPGQLRHTELGHDDSGVVTRGRHDRALGQFADDPGHGRTGDVNGGSKTYKGM